MGSAVLPLTPTVPRPVLCALYAPAPLPQSLGYKVCQAHVVAIGVDPALRHAILAVKIAAFNREVAQIKSLTQKEVVVKAAEVLSFPRNKSVKQNSHR